MCKMNLFVGDIYMPETCKLFKHYTFHVSVMASGDTVQFNSVTSKGTAHKKPNKQYTKNEWFITDDNE